MICEAHVGKRLPSYPGSFLQVLLDLGHDPEVKPIQGDLRHAASLSPPCTNLARTSQEAGVSSP